MEHFSKVKYKRVEEAFKKHPDIERIHVPIAPLTAEERRVLSKKYKIRMGIFPPYIELTKK